MPLIFVFSASMFLTALNAGPAANALPYRPVSTPNGAAMESSVKDNIRTFHLTVAPCRHEIAPGMTINAWCYNGRTPGPTIEALEGEKVRFYVTNKLPESTAVHWHGLFLPSGMDGVSGLTQKPIRPGETFLYEFALSQHGTFMYHSHGDEMTQVGLGAMGFFIIHPRTPAEPPADRDYAVFLNEWSVSPGAKTPDPSVMSDFNIFTFNGRAYPGTQALTAKIGEKVRIRFANAGQESHPIHLHGHSFDITATDGGPIPPSARWPETTVVVFPGQTRTIEFIAKPGDWAMHCHRRHHPMNPMGHGMPPMLGVDQKETQKDIQKLLPGYMAMGEKGMGEMAEMSMEGPENTLPMMTGQGPYGPVGMGGMFTLLMVGEELPDAKNPKWYKNPPGTESRIVPDGKGLPRP